VQRLLCIVILTITLIALPLLVLSDTAGSAADSDIPKNEVTSSISEASNSSADVTITITMHTGDGE